ncbi:AAA family ATPase [Neobacillus niacini]|uniref:McrB family protein n=1 Tax=Neobacillus niacini TaxID=86668 RepID=UPI003003A1E9
MHQKNTQNLVLFYNTIADEESRFEEIRGKSFEELLHFAEEEMHPSMVLGLLMSSKDEADQVNAEKIFITLKGDDRLDLLEKSADEKGQNPDTEEIDDKDALKQLKKEIRAAEKTIERQEKKLKKFEQKNEEIKALETHIQTTLKNERKQWKAEKKNLEKIIQGLKGGQTSLNNQVANLTSDKENLHKRLQNQMETVKTKNSEIAGFHAQILNLNTEITKIKTEIEKEPEPTKISITDDQNAFKLLLEAEEQIAAGLSTVLEKEVPPSRIERIEEQLLDDFVQRTKEKGLLYADKDLYNFHTAMKSSNLVILAGMSGIGKSKLVQAYGEALGLTEKYQITFIPVRPAWTDDADVIGYSDTLNHVYRPGDSGLINALLYAHKNKNKLHIICFDEMNLARVEHYFSQFLSILELEKGPNKVLRLYNEELTDSLKNSAIYPPSIPIGDNVIFVGTVNVDESTYHFSDKVLDRANVITPTVQPFENLKRLSQAVGSVKLASATISLEEFESIRSNNQDIQLKDSELALLWDIHTDLQKVNKNLGAGPRIVRQIDMYLKNLPNNSVLTREEAFDIQIVQRILTKVRGPEDQLKPFIGSYNRQTENIEESKLGEILDRYDEVSEFYETRNTLIQKAKELKLNGYTL